MILDNFFLKEQLNRELHFVIKAIVRTKLIN